jgi:cytochrome c553
MKKVLLLCTLIICLGLSLFALVIKQENTKVVCATPIPQFICGTRSFSSSEGASIGKQVFNTNCASCHKLDKKMTGPALRDIAQKYDSITLYNYIQGKSTKLLNRKTSGFTCVVFPQLTPEDISNILKYTN